MNKHPDSGNSLRGFTTAGCLLEVCYNPAETVCMMLEYVAE